MATFSASIKILIHSKIYLCDALTVTITMSGKDKIQVEVIVKTIIIITRWQKM